MLRRPIFAAILAVLLVGVLATPVLATGATAGAAKAKGHHHKKAKKKKSKKGKGKQKVAASLTVIGGTVTLTPSASAATAFAAHKLTVEVTAPATTGAGDAVTLTIASGTLNPSTGEGSLTLTGGYTYSESSTLEVPGLGSLSSGATASFTNMSVEFGAGNPFTATVNGTTGPFFTVKSVKPAKSGSTLTLANVPVTLASASAANLLDGFAESSTFTANGPFGTLTVQATT